MQHKHFILSISTRGILFFTSRGSDPTNGFTANHGYTMQCSYSWVSFRTYSFRQQIVLMSPEHIADLRLEMDEGLSLVEPQCYAHEASSQGVFTPSFPLPCILEGSSEAPVWNLDDNKFEYGWSCWPRISSFLLPFCATNLSRA